jgi:Ca2+-transporting ATPase
VAVVNTDYAYLHALDGRLRVKIAVVKGSAQQAQEIEQRFQACEGITQVTANPVTGNVLILYDSQQIKQEEVLDLQLALQRFVQELGQTLLRSTMEAALHRLVYALI